MACLAQGAAGTGEEKMTDSSGDLGREISRIFWGMGNRSKGEKGCTEATLP